ncbi:MAG: oxygen-independent coproporphyrinogen-3 oxidase [Cyclobacteriaceae bacterium]
MSGIYIHIPFCKQACYYCDFHFSTNLSNVSEMHQSICDELILRRAYLKGEVIHTIYFGGGTPSMLSGNQVSEILNLISTQFLVSESAEITLEANPDDLTRSKLSDLKVAGINRLSIGVQTFDDDRLTYVNRAHSSQEARTCIRNAYEVGFDNLTADLIYAIPPESMEYWEKDLAEMIQLGLPHISLYGLTIEDKTVFKNWLVKGKFQEISEDMAAKQYRYAIHTLKEAGYEHYEVSNFSKPGFASKHNSAYWSGEKYLGVGPGAHSYNGITRSSNIRNNTKYIQIIKSGKIPETIEFLTNIQLMNEFILTHLRTAKGINLVEFKNSFGQDLIPNKSIPLANFQSQGLVQWNEDNISLTIDGFLVADEIALDLFFEENESH